MSALIGLVLLTQPLLPTPALEPAPLEDPKPPVMHRWTGAVTLGMSLSEGNTERRTVSASADGVYRREKDRTTLQALWNYSDDDGSVTERRLFGNGKYDYFIDGEKVYVYGHVSGEYNAAAALDLRAIVGAGLGYQIYETAEQKLAAEAGLSYVDEDFRGSADDQEFLAARLAYNFEYKPNDRWSLLQTGEIFPSLEDIEDTYAKVDTRAKVQLSDSMFAQAQHLYTWDNTPAAGAERVDHLFLLSLGWSY